MAVLLLVHVAPATRDQHDELDARTGQRLVEAGGPPAGLMSHVVYPEADGFVIADVWRSEEAGRGFFKDVLEPLLTDGGLRYREIAVREVWGLARP